MKRRVQGLGALVIVLSLASLVALAEPPGENSNPTQAVNKPDAYAWELFQEINADAGRGDGRVVWETWKNVNNNTDIFRPDGSAPPAWDTPQPATRRIEDFESLPAQLRERRLRANQIVPSFDPNVGTGNEVRMNKAAFQFVVDNELYNLQGVYKFFSSENPARPRGFPPGAKEIKAQWRPLRTNQDPAKFHTFTFPGSNAVWGLTSLHITTKDLPNWFWATFEHKDNPDREAQVPSVDDAGLPDALRGTKWENYVLRGSQIFFTTPTGETTILASSQIENGFERTSSCITCHARATIGKFGDNTYSRLDFFTPEGDGYVGTPDPSWFVSSQTFPPQRIFFQTDFVWALRRAKLKQ